MSAAKKKPESWVTGPKAANSLRRWSNGDIFKFGKRRLRVSFRVGWIAMLCFMAVALLLACAPRLQPTVAPEPTATLAPTPVPLGLSMHNPLPAGAVLQGSDGARVQVLGVMPDAQSLVSLLDPASPPPEEGIASICLSYWSPILPVATPLP